MSLDSGKDDDLHTSTQAITKLTIAIHTKHATSADQSSSIRTQFQPYKEFYHGTASRVNADIPTHHTIAIRNYTLWKASGVKPYL